MKSLITALTVLFTVVCMADEPTGFRGIEWNSNLSKNQQFIYLGADSGLKSYKRINDKMLIGNKSLKFITYTEYKDKFFMIRIVSKEQYLKDVLELTYGKPYQSNPYIEDYSWTFNNVRITSKWNQFSGEVEILYFYIPVLNEFLADEKIKDAQAGKKDL